MERFTRRNLLGAASAFAGGATVARCAAAAVVQQPDPVPTLVQEYYRLEAVRSPPGLGDDASVAFITRACAATDRACDQVIATVAISPAGLIAQTEMLKSFVEVGSGWKDDRDLRLADTIIAGIRNLATGDAA